MINTETPSQLLTVKDVMHRLQISRQLLWNLRKEGKLSSVLIGDNVRFTEAEIQRFINASVAHA